MPHPRSSFIQEDALPTFRNWWLRSAPVRIAAVEIATDGLRELWGGGYWARFGLFGLLGSLPLPFLTTWFFYRGLDRYPQYFESTTARVMKSLANPLLFAFDEAWLSVVAYVSVVFYYWVCLGLTLGSLMDLRNRYWGRRTSYWMMGAFRGGFLAGPVAILLLLALMRFIPDQPITQILAVVSMPMLLIPGLEDIGWLAFVFLGFMGVAAPLQWGLLGMIMGGVFDAYHSMKDGSSNGKA